MYPFPPFAKARRMGHPAGFSAAAPPDEMTNVFVGLVVADQAAKYDGFVCIRECRRCYAHTGSQLRVFFD
jgi:hypothetical protein